MNLPANRPDYSTREVDFYYGVRGPALNSEGPGRKLGTGPADPTGPVATAPGLFRNMFKGKTKEKGKGFEVVRSSRMPPAMMRNGGFGDETPPEGIPVAMGVLRNGPIDSDDSDDNDADGGGHRSRLSPRRPVKRRPDDLLTDAGDPQTSDPDDPVSPVDDRADPASGPDGPLGGAGRISPLEDELGLPAIPRRSSKRNSGSIDQRPLSTLSLIESVTGPSSELGAAAPDGALARGQHHQHQLGLAISSSGLPFERTGSQRRSSSKSSLEFPGGFADVDLDGRRGERPASYGTVRQHGISRVDPEHSPVDLLGSSAELVDAGSASRRP
ncbi:hypothetical protein CDD83_5548 [Cordyceps sp. RAO-2017]|nr:hypothetical protein CDD83_5548 [Cordyceps sp. RAO-2017]